MSGIYKLLLGYTLDQGDSCLISQYKARAEQKGIIICKGIIIKYSASPPNYSFPLLLCRSHKSLFSALTTTGEAYDIKDVIHQAQTTGIILRLPLSYLLILRKCYEKASDLFSLFYSNMFLLLRADITCLRIYKAKRVCDLVSCRRHNQNEEGKVSIWDVLEESIQLDTHITK